MKTGLGLYRRYRMLYAYTNLFRFWLRNKLLGFDVANLFLQRVDKTSIKLILIKNGASIGNNCDVETGLIFHNCKGYSNLIIGNNSHIGKNCFFDLRDQVEIEKNVVISMQCTFITHIDINRSGLSKYYPATTGKISIEHDSYIGANCTILMNTRISNHSFIAAGSLVTKDVESHSMVGGIPATLIKTIK